MKQQKYDNNIFIAKGKLIWKSLEVQDIDAVASIACQLHPQLPERTDVLCEKISLFPQGCKKLYYNSTMVGYSLAHPWYQNNIPALDSFLGKLPDNPDCFYLHDIAILPVARRQGAAATCIVELISLAKQYNISVLSLVSVYKTKIFWEEQGFAAIDIPALKEKLSTYGENACYMQRIIY